MEVQEVQSASERRAHPRHPLALPVAIERCGHAGEPVWQEEISQTENLSKDGALVRTTLRIVEGEIIYLCFWEQNFETRAVVRVVLSG